MTPAQVQYVFTGFLILALSFLVMALIPRFII